MRRWKGLLAVALLPLAAGCSLSEVSQVDFNGGREAAQLAGFDDRAWTTAHRIGPFASIRVDDDGFESRGFDLKPVDGDVWLAATFYDSLLGMAGGKHIGYLRRYGDGSGWASAGSDFGAYVTLPSEDLGVVTLSERVRHYASSQVSPTYPLALFSELDGGGLALSRLSDGLWSAANSSEAAASSNFPQHPGAGYSNLLFDPLAIEDPRDRTWLFYQEGWAFDRIMYTSWSDGLGLDNTPAEFAAGDTYGFIYPHTPVAFDGDSRACMTYYDFFLADSAAKLRCLRGLSSLGTSLSAAVVLEDNGGITSSPEFPGFGGFPALGSAITYAGERGALMVAYHAIQSAGGPIELRAQRIEFGNPTASYDVLSDGMPSAYKPVNAAAPALAHLGEGYILAVWTAYNGTDDASALFSSLYTPDDGWSEPELIDRIENSTGPAYFTPVLYADDSGHAGIAVRYFSDWVTSVANSITRMKVGRYHVDRGWKALETVGSQCTAAGSSGTFYTGCHMPPKGVVLPSGRAVVVFQEQDGDGRYRLMATEFE